MALEKKTTEAVLAGDRVKECLRKLGRDRNWLATETGLSYSRLGNYEQGIRELGIREAKLIQEVTGWPAAYLMGLADKTDMALLMAPRETRENFARLLPTLPDMDASKPSKEVTHPERKPKLPGVDKSVRRRRAA